MLAEIGKVGTHPEVVLEATYGWYWAADVLADAGASVPVAHPLGIKGFVYRRVKNDVRDATDLADLLRMGRLPDPILVAPDRAYRFGLHLPVSDVVGVRGRKELAAAQLDVPYEPGQQPVSVDRRRRFEIDLAAKLIA